MHLLEDFRLCNSLLEGETLLSRTCRADGRLVGHSPSTRPWTGALVPGGRNSVEPDMPRRRAARGTLALHKTLDRGPRPWRAKLR